MCIKCAAVLLMTMAWAGCSQTTTSLNLATQTRNVDFSNFPSTKPTSMGAILPSNCQVGQIFFNTAAPAGANVLACSQQNTWSVIGAYTLPAAGPSTLGGVTVANNSGLMVGNNGALSVNVGTTAGTVAAGNDPRIVNALQPTSQIPVANVTGLARSATIDATNASNISSGTLSSGLLPAMISSSTTGNAASATTFSATPTACPVNQYATGISANGNAKCAQVGYSQVSGTPTLYNQKLQVSGIAQTQRANVNFAAGPNVTITPSDNGTNTTTLTLSASPGVSGVSATSPITSSGGSTPAISCPTCATGSSWFTNYALVVGQGAQALGALPSTGSTTQVLHGNSSGLPAWSPVNLATDVTGQLSNASVSGLSASATTDTTNAANISSGTLNSARLPMPSTLMLGGVESYAAVPHQWINSISTAGAPSSSQPAFSDLSGSMGASQLPALTGDTTTSAGSTVTTTAKVNGTSVPSNSSPDQTIVTTAAATGSWASLPACLDSGGNHLNYNPTTHSFLCGNSGGTVGSAAFGGLSGGTNTQAAMLVGTGASLAPTGSGTITANNYSGTLSASSLPAPTASTLGGVESYSAPAHQWINAISTAGVPLSSQPAASDIAGLAASATTDTTNAANISSGTLNPARLPNPSTSTLGGIESYTAAPHQWINTISTAGVPGSTQPAFSDLSGSLSAAQLPGLTGDTTSSAGSNVTTTSKVNGTSVPTNSSPDQTIVTTATATGSWASLPSCLDSGGNHLNYSTSTHTFSCGNTGGTAGSTAFGSLSSGTNTQAAMSVGTGASLAPIGSGTITANNYSGTLPASSLPAPTASTLGGVESYSAPVHQWINTISIGGVPSSAQPTAADIAGLAASATTDATNAANISSGTLNPARLPNPSASTLGGVESYAAAPHQWINSISTAGVPSSTQPAFSDISGSLGAAQLPALTGDTTSSAGSTATTTAKVNGTSVPSNSSSDQTIVTTAPATGSWASLPSCPDSSGNHLNYNTTMHTFFCGSTSSGSSGGGNLPGISANTVGKTLANDGTNAHWVGVSFDVTQFPGPTADVQLNNCLGTALVAGGGICDARGLTGTQSINSEVDVGELVMPQLAGGSGGSLAYGTYHLVYTETANSRESTSSIEGTITLSASNCSASGSCSITVTSPTGYYGATIYTPYITAAGGNSWTEAKCTATTVGTSALITSACSGTSISNLGTIVTLLVPDSATWAVNITDGVSCGIKSLGQSNIFGTGANQADLLIDLQSSGNVRAVWCTDPNPITGTSPYFHIRGIHPQSVSGGAVGKAVAEVFEADDQSTFDYLTVNTHGGIGLLLENACCATSFTNLAVGGAGASGSRPVVIGGGSNGGVVAVSILHASIDAAGPGQNQIQINSSLTANLYFHDIYMESHDTSGCTTPFIEVGGAGSPVGPVVFDGVHSGVVCPSNAAYLIDLASGVGAFTARDVSGDSYLINDHVHGTTISGVAGNLAVPEYAFGGVPSYFPSGISLVSNANQPVCGPGYEGTLWYSKGSGSTTGSFQICQNQSGSYGWVTH